MSALRDRLRYRAPLLLVHLMLLVLGLLNLYPFVWMLGTSLKAEAEASTHRMSPVPLPKYRLAEGVSIAQVLPEVLLPAADLQADRFPAALARLRAQLTLIDRLQRTPGSHTTPELYAAIARIPLAEAAEALRGLAGIGLLQRADAEADAPRYRLPPQAPAEIAQQLRPRQLLALLSLEAENRRRAQTRVTFAEDRITVAEYAAQAGLADLETAAAELEAMRGAGWLADATWQHENYWIVLQGEHLLLNVLTSLLVTFLVVVMTLMASSMLGYALARLNFPGRFWVLGCMIFASILPTEARMIPVFQLLMAVRGLETLWGMALWLTSFGVGNALLMAGFFLSLPKEVTESASVDGAGPFRCFFDIMLPMARPIVMTVGLFAFLTSWNEFLVPLLCTLSRPSMQPLSVAVYNLQAGMPGQWHIINAAASIMVLPVILGFLLVQKHVVNSIAVGAVKG